MLTSFFAESLAYVPADEAWFSRIPASGAVYLLTGAGEAVIQLASTGDLRRALKARLAPETATEENPTRSRRADLREVVQTVWWTPAHSAFELTWIYYTVARQLMPHNYLRQVGFGPAWFVYVDPHAAIPQLVVSKYLRGEPGMDLGPMATSADATRFVEILTDAFDLCRYYEILEKAPHGQACAYFEMGKCPAPCDGTIPLERYRQMMAEAVRFGLGDRTAGYERLDAAMRRAAAERAFERAGVIKKQLDRARTIEHPAFRHVRTLDRFTWLVLQRGPGRSTVKPFFVRGGAIERGEPVRLRQVDEHLPAWIERVRQPAIAQDLRMRSEQVWLVSHFLFKDNPPGLFVHASELDEPGLAERIRERFSAAVRPDELGAMPATPPDAGGS